MIGSKVTSFPKTHDAGYRSLARVVWACFCYKFSISATFHFVCVSSYYRALIRIRFAQINQTLHSTILVFIIVVSLHSDAYLRSLTLSHKIGGAKMCPFGTFWRKMCPFAFFLGDLLSLGCQFFYNFFPRKPSKFHNWTVRESWRLVNVNLNERFAINNFVCDW